MKRSVIILLSLVAAAGITQVAGAQTTTGKIGVVNISRLMQESPQAGAAQATLQSEFGAEGRQIEALRQSLQAKQDKLQKDQSTMSQAQVAAAERELRDGVIDLQAKQDKVEDKLKARQSEEQAKVTRALLEEVRKYAQANSYDVILADGVLYAGAALDITEPVLTALKARPVAAAPAAPAAAPAPAPAPAKPATK